MSVPALMIVSLPSGAKETGIVIVPPPSLKVMSFPIMDNVWNSLVESASASFTPSLACATQLVPFQVSTSLIFPEAGSSISFSESLSASPVLIIAPPIMSIPVPAERVEDGMVTVSPVMLRMIEFPEMVSVCNSLVALLSASSTPSLACATQSVPFHVSTSLVFPEAGSSISLLGSLSASSTSSFSTLRACKA